MSRSTFRDACDDVAWQKQLRDRFLHEGSPDVPFLKVKKATVKSVSRLFAERIIHKYEWLGTMAPTSHHYGIFFGNYCAGVCCFGFSAGANINAYKEFGLKDRNGLAYLARGANVHWSPKGANSKLVAWSCKLLAQESSAKVVIAYSDTDAGEIGTIYQACNWVCIGKGSSTTQWIAPNGRIFDQKYPSDLRRKNGDIRPRKDYVAALRKAGWKEQKSNPKHRYVYVLDTSEKNLVNLVESMRQPYPKRSKQAMDATSVTAMGQHQSDRSNEASHA